MRRGRVQPDEEWTVADERFRLFLERVDGEFPKLLTLRETDPDHSYMYREKQGRPETKEENGKERKEDKRDGRRTAFFRSSKAGSGPVVSWLSPRRVIRAACLVLAVFASASVMAAWIASRPAGAVAFQIQKSYFKAMDNLFSAGGGSRDDLEVSENVISMKYERMEDLPKAQRFLPELMAPGYLPQGFALKELVIQRLKNGHYLAEYHFEKGEEKLWINLQDNKNDSASSDAFAKAEPLFVEGQEVWAWREEGTGSHGANALRGDMVVSVFGTPEAEEILKVILGLKEDGPQD